MPDVMHIDWFALAPELTLLAAALAVLFGDLVWEGTRKRLVNPVALVGVLGALAWVVALAVDGQTRRAFGNMFVVDNYALLFKAFFLVTAAFVLLVSYRYLTSIRTYQGEYYFLVLAAFSGMLLMPSARDLVMIFIALELVSVPGFVMAGLRKFDLRSNEGALKFFLIGVLSVAVLLFGLSIVYGFTGTTDLQGVAAALTDAPREPLLLASLLFVIVGFGFKVSAVPFHFWAPDTYEGSPVPVAAFLSVASKAAGFAGLLQICFVAFQPLADVWAPILGIIAVLTMTLGNLTALQQRNVVRMFAFSSIAHAGYMLVPFGLVRAAEGDAVVAAVNSQAFAAVLIYLLAYAVMNVGAFAVVTAMAGEHPGRQTTDYAGLGQRNFVLAAGLTVFLVSLGGVPPVVGFWAKFFVISAAVSMGTPFAYFLASAVVVNAVLSMFYYLSIVRTMWMDAPTETAPVRPGYGLSFTVSALALVAIGVFFAPDLFANAAQLSTLVGAGP
ncbi:MAG TPA: NADH-quinone oxidoreductase subunit N [Egibacteraceae bacterium]|nr:NADH-quinone oxidoreductase subunit N [Egibacteraceae bacterium]